MWISIVLGPIQRDHHPKHELPVLLRDNSIMMQSNMTLFHASYSALLPNRPDPIGHNFRDRTIPFMTRDDLQFCCHAVSRRQLWAQVFRSKTTDSDLIESMRSNRGAATGASRTLSHCRISFCLRIEQIPVRMSVLLVNIFCS
jgi:hypothetical protein